MSYRDFSLQDLAERFDLRNQRRRLLEEIAPVLPSETLLAALADAEALPIRSQKAHSEWILVPILRELRERNSDFLTIYSGEMLMADAAQGLSGECDFMLAKDIQAFDLNYPILSIVEAKKHDLELGVPQCAAQLYGAKIFNQKQQVDLSKLYGCVTNGNDWLFLKLEGTLITIDTRPRYLNEVDNILGIFQHIIDQFREELRDVALP